ncbi:MAG: hypothetical protein Kow0073_14520 [Immundisolibacter sp.]
MHASCALTDDDKSRGQTLVCVGPSLARTQALIKSVLPEATPRGRWAQSQEVADAVLFLASDEARYITGTVLRVDGGRRSK